MSYNPAIPLVTDFLLQSQSQLRANFQAINNVFSNNHYSLTRNDDFQGMHNVLKMRPQNGDPTTDANHIAIYTKLISQIPQLFFAPNSAQTPIQLTQGSISTGSALPQQFTFSAGPFYIYGGIVKNVTQGQTITLTPTSTLLSVILNSVDPSPQLSVLAAIPTNITGSSFDIQFTNLLPGSIMNIYYLAMGH